MSGSLHPTEIHRRRHRKEKRNKLRAKLAAAPAGERAAIEAKLQRTYSLVHGTKPSSSAHAAAAVPRPTLPGALVPLRGKVDQVHAFLRLPPPRWAFSSPGPCPHQGSFPQKSGCHDHIPSLRTTCRTAAASPRTIPRNAGAQINQAAGHAVIWGGTLGVRRDAQGARDGELSVPRRRWRVCAIDHTLTNEPTATYTVASPQSD